MRFVYGMIFGVLVSVVSAILYLAFAGGEYLLALSPTWHEMRSRLGELEKAERHRAALAERLEKLDGRFRDLAQRFERLQPSAAPPKEPAPDEPGELREPLTDESGEPSPATPGTDE